MPPALSLAWPSPLWSTEVSDFGRMPTSLIYLPAARQETPAPSDLGPTGVFDSPTGQLTVVDPVDVVVQKAIGHIQAMSFLSIDPTADRCVDLLVARRLEGAVTKPLTRKVR
jgi:hypothetical protein